KLMLFHRLNGRNLRRSNRESTTPGGANTGAAGVGTSVLTSVDGIIPSDAEEAEVAEMLVSPPPPPRPGILTAAEAGVASADSAGGSACGVAVLYTFTSNPSPPLPPAKIAAAGDAS